MGELESLVEALCQADPRSLPLSELGRQIIEICEVLRVLEEERAELQGILDRRAAARRSSP